MLKKIILSLLLSSNAHQALAEDGSTLPSRPIFMAVFGDSVTKATMANEALGEPSARFFVDMIRSRLNDGLYSKLQWLSRNQDRDEFYKFNRLFGFMARPKYSWLTGEEDYSVKRKIEAQTANRVEIYDGTIMGSGYFGYQYMLEDFRKWMALRVFHKTPDIVVLTLGGMDVANNFSVEEFHENVREFVTGVTKLAPKAHLIITGLPNIVPVMTHENRVAIPADSIIGELTCQDMYENMGFGKDLELNDKSTEEQKQRAYNRILDMREVLGSEIDLAKNRQLYSWFKGKITYVELPDPNEETVHWMAADCVHPDIRGQRVIAEDVWDAIEIDYN